LRLPIPLEIEFDRATYPRTIHATLHGFSEKTRIPAIEITLL
jgi:hypothetical protein